jgi:transcriptional regulator with XRE-family HTH domain
MGNGFRAKLELVLKALSISRGQLAAELGVDKSAVGRWVTGAAEPTGYNLARLTAAVARRVEGFSALDWDRDLGELAQRLGAGNGPGGSTPTGLPLNVMDEVKATTHLRSSAYQGFFRSTRPYVLMPGRFVHDHGMIRMDPASGLLALKIGSGGTWAEGWMLPLHNQLFAIASDAAGGAVLFGLFNGVAAPKVEVVDGLVLAPALDPGRTPTAYAMMFERVADLSGDPAADDATFVRLASQDSLAPEGSIPDDVAQHLLRDIGPAQVPLGGDLLLRLPIARSLARGATYREPANT